MAPRVRVAGGEFTLLVSGLAALQRDLGRVSKDARSEVREGLKGVAGITVSEAKRVAAAKGLHDSGDLIRKIVPTVNQQGVFVVAKAKRRGYPYPAIYEFGGRAVSLKRKGPGMTKVTNRSRQGATLARYGSALGSAGEYGPRAFLWPAAMNKADETERALGRWLDSFLSQNNL